MPQAPISKPHDGANFSIVPGAYALPLIMTCEHASNALPPEYGQLGLPQDTLDSHFGWDIGAWATLLRIASTINCSVIGSLYSLLLVDLNRRTDESSLIPRQLGGQIIPGNWPLPSEEAWGRIERFYDPYHDAI